ncbi:CRISPR-associated endonuclease Cas2 [Alkalimonas sp. MEB108]|uniref:CRISPR-associated endoribonuclease Cas2 n=1 Tax=Alkalimonas cellulosilytica TaxID=3058395 RepID=A0ABU7J9D9_9GAMM|nr:CRISPR-associated endonuclease Cas2 [Alkalimonas sp. MEB108]MEE2003019.1 CRISPR-associated endonuclease Cas2 [Alkalimonas sp. MEB108]
MRQRYIVAYDIACRKRRYRIERLLCEYGDRLQYSIFEVIATPAQQRALQRKLKGMMCTKSDALNCYTLSEWAANNAVLKGQAAWSSEVEGSWCIG